MNRYCALALGLAAGLAVGTDWRDVFDTASGTWALQPSTRAVLPLLGRDHRTARLRLAAANGRNTTYVGAVPVEHCGRERGDVLLLTLEGKLFQQHVFVAGSGSLAAALATELCKGPR